MTAPSEAAGARAGTSRLARDLRTLPNLISLSRIVLIFAATILFFFGHALTMLIVGTIAGFTDYLDGYVARRTNQVTELGAILDRLCDLIFESTWLLLASAYGLLHPVFFMLYLIRELVVLSARLYCGERGVSVPSSLAGKAKSNFFGYTAFILFISLADVIPIDGAQRFLHLVAIFGMSVGLILSYWSGYAYLGAFVRTYNSETEASAEAQKPRAQEPRQSV